jgi:transcriptional regulator with XRE-family HTH domain
VRERARRDTGRNDDRGRRLGDELKDIAERVKRWRLDAGLTLQAVSERSGVSASTVHKIENLQTVPTISVLLKVAHGLGRQPHELFGHGDVTPRLAAVVRAEDRDELSTGPGALLERVTGAIDQEDLNVWRVTHPPGCGSRAESDSPALSYHGEVVILVEVGRLHVTVGEEEFDLGPGDTLHFKTKAPHFWENRGSETMSAYFCGTTPGLRSRRRS